MGNKYDFLQASLNETIYRIPDGVKLSISSNKINPEDVGKNQVENLILYQPASGEDLTEEFRVTLDKIISVIPNQPGNSANLNFSPLNSTDFQSLHKLYGFKNLICFGIKPSHIGMHVQYDYYRHITINDILILFSEAVEHLDKAKKTKLWSGIQKMYGLK